MKIGFSKIVACTVLTAGLVSMSATGALAKKGNGGGGGNDGGGKNVAVCTENVFASLAAECKAESGNDNVSAIETLFGQTVVGDYKVDSHSGTFKDLFTVKQTSKGAGTLSFLDEKLVDSTFAFVLKGGNGYAAYRFDGIDDLTNLTWETGGPDLSHSTLYVFDKPASSGDVSQEVPEPASLLGLIAVGGMLVGKKGLSRKS